MKIILDVDGPVADFIGGIVSLIDRPNNRHEATEWDWWNTYADHDKIKIEQALRTRNFWENLPITTGALPGIQYLRDQGHEIIWCTSPYSKCPVWVDARYKWLEKNFQRGNLEEPIVFTRHKYLIRATAMIEDHPLWLTEWEKAWKSEPTVGFLFGTEMNQKTAREKVIWKDIMKMEFFSGQKYHNTF